MPLMSNVRRRVRNVKPKEASPAITALVLVAFGFVIGGIVLEVTTGSRFVFYFERQYTAVGWCAFALLLPVFGIPTHRYMKHAGRHRYPTWAVRWLFMYPLTTAFGSAAVVIAPLGWIATYVSAAGATVEPNRGQLVSVDDYRSSRRGCDQRAKLAVRDHLASVCLEGIAALPMKRGPVIVQGKAARLGFLVERIAAE